MDALRSSVSVPPASDYCRRLRPSYMFDKNSVATRGHAIKVCQLKLGVHIAWSRRWGRAPTRSHPRSECSLVSGSHESQSTPGQQSIRIRNHSRQIVQSRGAAVRARDGKVSRSRTATAAACVCDSAEADYLPSKKFPVVIECDVHHVSRKADAMADAAAAR
jgi:hypothetical protein